MTKTAKTAKPKSAWVQYREACDKRAVHMGKCLTCIDAWHEARESDCKTRKQLDANVDTTMHAWLALPA